MKRKCFLIRSMILLIAILSGVFFSRPSLAKEQIEEQDIYAQAAVLMDADSGRILFAKNGNQKMAVASTTKIMTCILVLEEGELSDYTQISKYAASQPEVNGDLREGEYYLVEDLLIAMMLESHNDAAVALAEYIANDVKSFATKMNQKACQLGCTNSYFLTPNGLDAVDQEGNENGASAQDMAKILRYCIMESPKRESFLELTMLEDHSYRNYLLNESNQEIRNGKRNFYVTNKNAYRQMRSGVLTGKTGFTSKAGYCYVCAVHKQDVTLILVLLGSGWPPDKTNKWMDCNRILSYGFDWYHKEAVMLGKETLPELSVRKGVPIQDSFETEARVDLHMETKQKQILMNEEEKLERRILFSSKMEAPIRQNEVVGRMQYWINDQLVEELEIYTDRGVKRKNKRWYFQIVCVFYIKALT